MQEMNGTMLSRSKGVTTAREGRISESEISVRVPVDLTRIPVTSAERAK